MDRQTLGELSLILKRLSDLLAEKTQGEGVTERDLADLRTQWELTRDEFNRALKSS